MAAILIVDPDRAFREALAIALRLDGHDAAGAPTVDDARARMAGARLDCCIVDALLPEAGTLLELAAASGIRTIVTGRYADLLAAAAARHPGARALLKPFRAADVTAVATGPGAAAP
jgi:DNA-binding NtrC family response regulator